jgi:tRNA A-37 threonylcarbamoyl transferase component Bud32
LGAGGFGVVYLAADPALDRDVAIKLPIAKLRDRSQSDAGGVLGRFAKEARSAAKLRHPNIVSVFDHGESEQGAYIVYEYVPGRTLEDLIKAESEFLTEEQAIEWIAVLAEAISYAAGEGIVHRDIKPANIMIDTQGRPQIMDFGLAEVLKGGVAATGGKIAGTPAYMSPEQAGGADHIDSAADQYGLAAILYEMVTGTRPVTGNGLWAISEVLSREHPPLEPLKALPVDLREIILKAMHREPSQRYQDCRDFAADLRAYLSGHPVTANLPSVAGRLAKWAKRNRGTAGALSISILLLVAIAVGSSSAALVFKKQRGELDSLYKKEKDAVKLAKEAKIEAEAAELEADFERFLAEVAKAVAESDRDRAEAEKLRAEKALNDLQLAEKKVIEEAERREKADMVARKARGQLIESEQQNRELKYADALARASGELLRGESSLARKILEDCDPTDRGWEWDWLHGQLEIDTNFTPTEDVSETLVASLIPPRQFVTELRFQPYFPLKSKQFVAADWKNDFQTCFDPGGGRVLVVKPIGQIRSRPGATLRTSSWALFGPGNRVVPLGQTLGQISGINFISKSMDIVSLVRTVEKAGNQDAERTFEIWSLSGSPRRLVQEPWAGYGFVPSSVVVPQRQMLIIAAEPKRLVTRALPDGEVVKETDVDFQIASGPSAVQLAADGNLVICGASGRFHWVSTQNAAPREGKLWGAPDGEMEQLLWNRTGRYLAVSAPEKISEVIVDPNNPPNLTKTWSVVDSVNDRKLATLEMPLSEAQQRTVSKRIGNRQQTETILERQALPIVWFEVADDLSAIVACDASGGVWGWRRRGGAFGKPDEREHGFPNPLKLAKRDRNLLVGSDGNDVLLEIGTPTKASSKPKRRLLKRWRGGSVTGLAVDAVSNRVATLDDDGTVTVFEDGRRIGKPAAIRGAKTAEFIERGELLVIGTESGELVSLDGQSGQVKRRSKAHVGAVTALVHAVGHELLISSGQDRLIRFWDTETGLEVPTIDTFMNKPITGFEFDRESSRLVAYFDRNVVVYECAREGLIEIGSADLPHQVNHAILFDRADRILIVCGRTCTIWNAHDGRQLFTLPTLAEEIVLAGKVDDDPWLLTSDAVSMSLRTNR